MANAKRASMREGPLAALFRKTEEARGRRGPSRRTAPAAEPSLRAAARGTAPPPRTHARAACRTLR